MVYSKLIKPNHRVEQLIQVNYPVAYRKDGSVETHISGLSVDKKFIPKNKR